MTIIDELIATIHNKRVGLDEPDRITLTSEEFDQLIAEIRAIGTYGEQQSKVDHIYFHGVRIDHA